MKIHLFQHVLYEGPAAVGDWAASRNHELAVTKMFEMPRLPDINDVDMLILMGGPMGVYDEDRYGWLKAEKAFLKTYLKGKGRAVGVCLGAQLIAEALGARVYPHTEKEIGWYPVEWNPAFQEHANLAFLSESPNVLHWHGDTFDLPEKAQNVGLSAACGRQGFWVDDHILALQFHLEMTPDSLQKLIANSADELSRGGLYVQKREQMMNSGQPFDECNKILFRLLDWFTMRASKA